MASSPVISFSSIRDLKQARTATAVNKQLNFTVEKKPDTTDVYPYTAYSKHIL